MPENRRTSTRHVVELPCTFTVTGDASGPAELALINLSIGGALVRRPRLPLGVRVQLAFRVPNLDDTISTGAVVRWSTDDEVGVQFDGLRPRDVWALSKYFESLS
ncbi:MAG TPA: PilZ domain-containing protein [Kofleriaceae bacterium]|nr:PilZ domain-containing protein [Kofleriaceae bacterium]